MQAATVARITKTIHGTCFELLIRIFQKSKFEIRNSKITSVGMPGFITLRGRPIIVEEPVLDFERVTEEALRVDSFRSVVRAGINAARDGQLGAEIAGVCL